MLKRIALDTSTGTKKTIELIALSPAEELTQNTQVSSTDLELCW